jgi:hypothetical protein
MQETIEFPYSKNSALLGVGVPVVFFLITFVNLKNAFLAGLMVSWMIIALADLIFITQILYVFITRLIPALQNKIALELTEEGIKDYIRQVEIEWKDIKGISWEKARNASKIVLDLKEETDYGSQIAISLRWVKGRDEEICETVIAYFDEVKSY